MGPIDERPRTLAAKWPDSSNLSAKPAAIRERRVAKERTEAGPGRSPSRLVAAGTLAVHQFVRGVDRVLRRAMNIREFCGRPGCIFRVAQRYSMEFVVLQDGTEICPGDSFGDLHLWNENVGSMLGRAVGLGVGARLRSAFLESLQDLALHATTDPQIKNMRAFRAQVCWLWRSRRDNFETIIRHCGFTVVSPDRTWIGRVHDAFENVLIYSLVWSFNPNGLRRRCPTPLRLQLWISREELLRRHLPGEHAPEDDAQILYRVDRDRDKPVNALDSAGPLDKLDGLLSVKEYHR